METTDNIRSSSSINYWEYIYSKLFTLFDTDDAIQDREISARMKSKESRENYFRAVENLRSAEIDENREKEEEVRLDEGKIRITLG